MSVDVFRRPLHCYILLSIWILLLVGGVYKYLEPKPRYPTASIATEQYHNLVLDVKTKRIFKVCNLPDDIKSGDEGFDSKQWTLRGLLVLIRHGDRGPLQHVTNISYVNCGYSDTDAHLKLYQDYLHNLTVLGKVSWIGPGAFHGFPVLPTHATQCQIGQLTMQGVAQLLKLGQVLRESYVGIWQKLLNLTQSEIVVYSTRYRRTFQSALAFLYGFVTGDTLSRVTILESQSMSFCFRDCGCPVADTFYRSLRRHITRQLLSHPAVALLSETTGRVTFSVGAEQGILGVKM
uniref:2-phosphoxylose phosphatase 1 n=1 Tax=Photinus pyralis TaxID=7054 RepID=A0A1Y1KPX7_PHOPY